MGSRYLFIPLYCWLEKYVSQGDYWARNEVRVPERPMADPSDQRPGHIRYADPHFPRYCPNRLR